VAIGARFWYLHGIFKWVNGITGDARGPIFDVASPWAQRIHSGGQLFVYNVQPDHDGGIGTSGVVHRSGCGDFNLGRRVRVHRCEIRNRHPRTPIGKGVSKHHFDNVNNDEHQFVNVIICRAKLRDYHGATLGFAIMRRPMWRSQAFLILRLWRRFALSNPQERPPLVRPYPEPVNSSYDAVHYVR